MITFVPGGPSDISYHWRRSHFWPKEELFLKLPPYSLGRHVYDKGLDLHGQKNLKDTGDGNKWTSGSAEFLLFNEVVISS